MKGHAIRYHANSFEVTIYDKLKDLEKAKISEKRAIERDYGPQLDLFSNRGSFPKALEVLRMEVRLGNCTKVKNVVKQFGAETEPTFAALFNAWLAKAVLMQYWKQVRSQMPLMGRAKAERPEDLLASLAVAAKGRVRPGTLLQQLGCRVLVASVGLRAAGAILSRQCSKTEQKRQLIAFVFSNLRLKGKKLEFSLRSPFDLMVNRANHTSWLPFLDTYRTMCLAPQPEFREILEHVRSMQLAA
jgi:hypothetical protein